jgi:hypothetical protein
MSPLFNILTSNNIHDILKGAQKLTISLIAMYTVISAPNHHITIIADLLSQHFDHQNAMLGTSLYNSNYQTMERIVSERMSDEDSPYKYLSLTNDAGACLGFVNIYQRGATGEIQIVLLVGNDDSEEKINLLLDAANDYLKANGVETICTEVSANEKVLRKILHTRRARLVSENLVFGT